MNLQVLVVRDIYSGHFPGGGGDLSKLKNRKRFEGGLHEKRKGKEGKRRKGKRVIKQTLNTFKKHKWTQKNAQKQGRI